MTGKNEKRKCKLCMVFALLILCFCLTGFIRLVLVEEVDYNHLLESVCWHSKFKFVAYHGYELSVSFAGVTFLTYIFFSLSILIEFGLSTLWKSRLYYEMINGLFANG